MNIPPALRERLRDSHNAMIAALIECYGADSPLIKELGGYDLSMPEEHNHWYEEYLESEKDDES